MKAHALDFERKSTPSSRDVFGLTGVERLAYILDTFPIVRKADEKAHGEYRTKRVILEIFNAMTGAVRTRQPSAAESRQQGSKAETAP